MRRLPGSFIFCPNIDVLGTCQMAVFVKGSLLVIHIVDEHFLLDDTLFSFIIEVGFTILDVGRRSIDPDNI